jgi:outer membrane receptor protein involved in Fe transport
VPNIPDVFFNSSVQYSFSSLLKEDDQFKVFWNYFFVDQFSITYVLDEDKANPDNLVPIQNQHDLGVTYAPSSGGLKLSFQVNNITNAQLFDNFRIPKPGLNFSFKINYSI